jgi:DNA-binding CsgD family transcriptional regulator
VEHARGILTRAVAVTGAPGWLRLRARLELGAIEAAASGDVERLREARAAAEQVGASLTAARAELLIGLTLVRRHELAGGREYVTRALDLAQQGPLRLLEEAQAAQAELLVVSGEPRVAARHVDSAGAFGATARLLLAAASGDPVSLDELASAIGPGVIASGLRACSAGDVAAGTVLLERFPWFRHLALLRAGEAAVREGWGDPVAWLTNAMNFFGESRNQDLARSCRVLLRRAGAKVPRRGRGQAVVPAEFQRAGVTSREMDVLELVGQGLRNREIAQRLFLSPRTIETHLQTLQRKLDAPSRARLTTIALQVKGG